MFSDWFRFKISCTESWYVVITDDSSRDLVNELIHHSFISEVRLKTHWFTLHTVNFPFSLCSSSQSISVSFLACDMKSHWKQQLQLNVYFLSYAHILPSISTGGWWQDRSIPGGSFEPTPWVCWCHNNHLNNNGHGCDGHLHASGTWEAGPPTEGEDNGNTWSSLSVSMDNWNCGQKRQNMAYWFYDNMRLTRLEGTRNAHSRCANLPESPSSTSRCHCRNRPSHNPMGCLRAIRLLLRKVACDVARCLLWRAQ